MAEPTLKLVRNELNIFINSVEAVFQEKSTPKKNLTLDGTFPLNKAQTVSFVAGNALAAINKFKPSFDALGSDMDKVRYVVAQLNDLKAYFDYIIDHNGKLPPASWKESFLGMFLGKSLARFNNKKIALLAQAIIGKLPLFGTGA